MELKDKIALVTGGGQGIGQVIGNNLAKSGAHVIFGDINLENADKSAESVLANGGNASATLINVADAENVKVAFNFIAKEFIVCAKVWCYLPCYIAVTRPRRRCHNWNWILRYKKRSRKLPTAWRRTSLWPKVYGNSANNSTTSHDKR